MADCQQEAVFQWFTHQLEVLGQRYDEWFGELGENPYLSA